MEINFTDVHNNQLHWYLTTSPEFAIKKLLAEGARNVYQLSHVFRGGEAFGGTHNPEFMMLEWYRTPGDYNDIMRDTEELIWFVSRQLQKCHAGASAIASTVLDPIVPPLAGLQDDNTKCPSIPFHRLTVADAFLQYSNLQISDFNPRAWIDNAKKFGHNVATLDDAFFALFLNLVENKLPPDEPTFITDYPLFQAALAKKSKDGKTAERCELYWKGLELANGFSELTDADEQLTRFKKEQEIRKSLGKPVYEIDPDFIAALKKGFPPTGGIALGVDRLLMALTGVRDINEVLLFSNIQ